MSMAAAGSTAGYDGRTCWRAVDMGDAVLFHGRYNHEFMAHSHDVLTLILVTGGRVEIDIEKQSYRVEKGEFVAIGAHQIHAARPIGPEGWKMRSLHLRPEALARRSGLTAAQIETIDFVRPVHRLPPAVSALFFDTHYCSQVGGEGSGRSERFNTFLGWFSKNMDILAPKERSTAIRDEKLVAARCMLADRLFENVALERVAESVNMSPYGLIRGFRRQFGICPHTWRMQERAKAAAQRLNARATLVDIALSCGFSDQSHMCRVFKKVFGVTPGQYSLMHLTRLRTHNQ